jgi:hypothetical protein
LAQDENDMSGRAATASENEATQRARRRAIEGDAPPSAQAIGEAVARALDRQRDNPIKETPLPEIVRASVRAGYETARRVLSDGSTQMVTSPASITFKREDTPDGREVTVVHGKPVKLKREAFIRYRRDGKVVLAQ